MANNENFDLDLQDEDAEDFVVNFGEVTNAGGGGGTSNFNDLTNRPKYNNQTMTGSTDIPKVPAKTSDLENDSGYQNGTQVENAIETAIGQIEIPTKTSDLDNDGEDGTSTYVEASDLAKVATTGDYDDLIDKPTIPTVNDATLTITQNGTSKGTFTANDADDTTIEVSDTTYSNFTGTDGVSAGTAGLVPAPATTDAGKFLKADGTWDTAGGGGPTVVQTTGTSTTDVMSQNAVTNMIYKDPGTNSKIVIGAGADVSVQNYNMAIGINANSNGVQSTAIGYSAKARPNGTALGYNAQAGTTSSQVNATAIGQSAYGGGEHCTSVGDNTNTINSYSTAIGANARARSERSLAIGASATVENNPAMAYSVALGANSATTRAGEVNVGTGASNVGYNSSNYRVIGGVHDPVDAHDAATKNYVDSIVINYATLTAAGAPTTSTVATSVGQLYYDSTNDDYYYCSAIDTTDPDNPSYTWSALSTGGGGGVTPVQTTGTSTTDVMSQDATSSMVFADPGTDTQIKIGAGASARSDLSIAIGASVADNGAYYNTVIGGNSVIATGRSACVGVGFQTSVNADNSVVIGRMAKIQQTSSQNSVALGSWAEATRKGEVNVGNSAGVGFNNTNYRVIGGVHDGQLANDCATVGQINATIDAINTALSTNIPHVGA